MTRLRQKIKARTGRARASARDMREVIGKIARNGLKGERGNVPAPRVRAADYQ